MSDAQVYSDAMKHSSFDYKTLTEYMRMVRHKTFKFLYDFQNKSSEYSRFDFTGSQLKLMLPNKKDSPYNHPRKYTLFIDRNFIHKNNRLAFKRSSFYNEEISMYDIAAHPEVFKYSYLIFVEGKFIDCTNLVCKDEITYLIIDSNEWGNTAGLPVSFIQDLITRDVPITVYFMPNTVYGIYDTNVNVIRKYENRLSLSKFDIVGHLTDEATYITFINDNALLYESIMCDSSADQFLKFYAGNDSLPFDSKLVHFNVFGMRNILDEVVVPSGTTYFELPISNYPVPTEPMLIFRDIGGRKEFAHDVKLKLYYPNIYKIEENDQPSYDLHIFVVYFDDTPNSGDLKYKNQLELYYRFFANDILSKYENLSIPDIISNYDEGDYEYSLPDYFGHVLEPNTLTYKIDQFNAFIENDPNIIREYFHELFKSVKDYMIDVSQIDLLTRRRSDNHTEIISPTDQETFTEDRYVFQFIDFMGTDRTLLTIFIDGYYYIPDKQFSSDGMRFLYIPITLVHDDSFIEVNVDALFNFYSDYQFPNTTQYVEFNCNNSDKLVMACDIYLVDESLNLYVDKDKYDILIDDDFGGVTSIGSNTCRNIHDKFYVQLLDPDLVGHLMRVRIDKIGHTRNWTVGPLIGGFNFPVQVNNDVNYFKIYKSGALLPRTIYNITLSHVYATFFYIDLNISKPEGTVYNIQYTSNRFTPLLFLSTIPDDGIIEVNDLLDRPFDYHTFEYYLNGKKLNYTNIEILTPHTLLVKNVQSRKNFEILERNMDDDQFFIYQNALTDINTAIYNLPEFQSEVIAHLPIIPDTLPNVVGDILDPNNIILIQLFLDFITGLRFINPDTEQITPQALIDYAPVLTAPYVINPDADGHTGPNDLQKLYINPDVTII